MVKLLSANRTKATLRTAKAGVVAVACILLSGCGDQFSGTYLPANRAKNMPVIINSLTFTSGDIIEISMRGVISEFEYAVEGDKLKLINGGQNMIFKINEDGCLDSGNEVFGVFCQK